ncbi:pectinesterase family protein [Fontibacillus sp. BL9]|uniref:pectinesterase family protein n=1 Tax=Fontibacillus sp. BL9 TaxID=3389971 RepID=UPI003977F99F
MLVGTDPVCDFRSIQEAVDDLERRLPDDTPAEIHILPGVYEEVVRVYRSNLSLIGIGQVEIVMNRYARERDEQGNEIGTFGTPTLFLGGSRLIVENLVIANTAGQGEDIGQALAVYAHCDCTVFSHCTLKGHQDTLFLGPLPATPKERVRFGGIPLREHHAQYRQWYRHCRIEGTVDFIFGGATAFFEHSEIRSLRHAKESGAGYITAASTPEDESYGFVFKDCYLTAEEGVPDASVFLGRPWRPYAKTAFVNCRAGGHIQPQGWDNWNNPANEATVCYGEYEFNEAASLRPQRVEWAACSASGGEAWRKERVLAGNEEDGRRWLQDEYHNQKSDIAGI